MRLRVESLVSVLAVYHPSHCPESKIQPIKFLYRVQTRLRGRAKGDSVYQ